MASTMLPTTVVALSSTLLLLALAVVPRTAANEPCYEYADCHHCTSAAECGWERDSFACVRGTVDGPKNGFSSHWDWTSDQCCQEHNCTSCVRELRCGWEGNEGSCSAGNADGPYLTSSISWVYDNINACPAMCDSKTDCGSCLGNGNFGNCVWAGGRCMAGNEFGPFLTYGNSDLWHAYTCPPTWNWEWSIRSIPVWLTFGCLALLACFGCLVAIARRRRRILSQQQGLHQEGQQLSYPHSMSYYPQPVMGTAAAPLMGSTANVEAATSDIDPDTKP